MTTQIEYTPAHIAELERSIASIKEQKRALTTKKIEYEKDLSELNLGKKANRGNNQLRGTIQTVKEKLSEINSKILVLNTEISKKATLKQDIQLALKDKKLQLKATPKEMLEYNENLDSDSELRLKLIDLKDEYLDFSGDHTRVSSMRQMAAEFVKKLDALLKNRRPK